MHDARMFDWTGPFRDAVRVGLDCSRGMKRTMQMLAAHCALKQSSDILASPGTMLAPALSTDREQQWQHILTPISAKAILAQRHVHRCSICEAARHTHRRACTHAHTHTHVHSHTRTHECARAHTYKHKCARVYT